LEGERMNKKSWQIFAAKIADKLMDAGNIAFGALVIGQLISGQPFNWTLALLGFGAWVALYLLSFFAVIIGGEE